MGHDAAPKIASVISGENGDTGITAFITNQSGVVYEEDLGKNTAAQATTTTEFNPDKSWATVPE
jgi:hypothetical protein